MSIHNGGGVGIGYSQHAGMVVVADGTGEIDRRLERVLTSDPGLGVIRHADAGYPEAIPFAETHGIKRPGALGNRFNRPAQCWRLLSLRLSLRLSVSALNALLH